MQRLLVGGYQFARFGRRRISHFPHFFDIVEIAYFRTEEVDNDIPGIADNPVALIRPFGAEKFMAAPGQPLFKLFSHADNLPGRSAARHNHVIGQGGLIGQIDDLDVQCFVIIKRCDDKVF